MVWLDNFLRGESRSRVIETSPNTLQEILMELRIQRGKIDEKIEKMENRYSQLRRRCMEALRKGDRALAVIYANEAAFVRKIAHELLINRITFDRAILRLELLLELEGMSDILRSVREIVERMSASLVRLLPDVAVEIHILGERLGELSLNLGEVSRPVEDPVGLEKCGENILKEASGIISRMRPEIFLSRKKVG
ncbi:MAG TPA: hypothetical protein ENF41_04575 [Candidatus Bathyarchaeota archaeon]|nr:hypothetical protein [Candidatus Bathyarchaeota archaeon]